MSKLSNRVRATSLACTFALAGAVGGGQLATNASAATAKYTVKTFNFNPLNGHGNTQARDINEKGETSSGPPSSPAHPSSRDSC
jgi:hypothetical protein